MARHAVSITIAFLFMISFSICGAEQEYHVIQTGETLYSIAKSYAVPFETLAQVNGITDPSKIRPGTVLRIPLIHVVAKGETFYGIAKKYGVSVQELQAANSLPESYVLKVGDVLLIPEPAHGVQPIRTSSVSTESPSSSTTTIVSNTSPSASAGLSPAPSQASTSVPSSSGNSNGTPSAPAAAAPAGTQDNTLPVSKPQGTPASTPSPSPGGSQPSSMPTPPSASAATSNATRSIDPLVSWPVEGKAQYMNGKLEGIMFKTTKGAPVRTIASGTVVSAGPSRGFGEVVFVQSKSGFVYVYGGNETILVKTGDAVEAGKIIGKAGFDAKEGTAISYFFVFRNGQPVDPGLAPRE